MNKVYEKWCEKLLDTGKGNRLINFKESQLRTLEILVPSAEEIWSKITKNEKLSFYNLEDYLKEKKEQFFAQNKNISDNDFLSDNYNSNLELKISKDEVTSDLAKKLSKKEILGYKPNLSCTRTLSNLKKIAGESIIEKGINILYLTFGMLVWNEREDNLWLSSPLVLVGASLDSLDRNKNYTICQYEEEFTTNPTLVYKLKSEYNLTLPELREQGFEDEGLNDYFERVNEFCKGLGWKVTRDVKIGTFSFLKLDMYKDLKEHEDEFLANPIIKKLLNLKEKEEDALKEGEQTNDDIKKENESSSTLDEKLQNDTNIYEDLELNLHNVVDADSSQMAAIMQAKKGESFVLQGPPGTGKSQTITNLIAELLYDDKKVLFVSEKLAALNVVHNNLKKVGMSDFCLELHSNKTNKKDVISELYRVLMLNKKSLGENAEIEIGLLKKYKNQLDGYVKSLHEKVSNLNKSPYEIIARIADLKDITSFDYAFDDIGLISDNYILRGSETINLFSKYSELFGYDYKKSNWYGCSCTNLSYKEKLELKNQIESLCEYFLDLDKLSSDINKLVNLNINNLDDIKIKINLLRAIINVNQFDCNIFKKPLLKKLITKIRLYLDDESATEELKNEILETYNADIFDIDAKSYYERFSQKYSNFFRIFSKKYKNDNNLLKSKQKNSLTKLKFDEVKSNLEKLSKYTDLKSKLSSDYDEIVSILSDKKLKIYTKNFETVYDNFTAIYHEIDENFNAFDDKNAENFEEIKTNITKLLNFYDSQLDKKDLVNLVQERFDERLFKINSSTFKTLTEKFKKCLSSFDEFDNWQRFCATLGELDDMNLKKFVDVSIDNNIDRKTLALVFEKMIYTQIIYYVIDTREELADFTRMTQDASVSGFKKKDKLKFDISKAEIISKVLSKMPSVNNVASGSQVSILVREANKKSKQKPVRLLFKEIDQLVQTLKPCFLMSPLSVSSYIDSDSCKFDVVIFDEASQIFPWDSIGSIARAKQVIVVGDSKQMPPSNFFNANLIDSTGDEDEYDDYSLDFESILDLSSAVLNQNRLGWHYRSKTEELISFSNKNFYDGSLVTFPTAYKERENMGVDFFYVADGVFDRKSKTNAVEAEKVVDLVFEHFDKTPELSLGVVAFSISQQAMIEDIIQKRRENDSKYDKYFDSALKEPFFVKNLETVQGDERDVIIFSVAYAKDINGKFLHNFGPLNKKGGERRLNVAVTRAKQNVKLVASIKSSDIDLERSSAVGTRLLKEYLLFAQNGSDSSFIDVTLIDEKMNGVENEIFEFLTENGFKVKRNIGHSDYKIDIAVQNPISSDYVLAIECDGKNYKKSKTTRDRDRLRQEVLERLGWKFYRVWSLDWLLNNSVEKKKLLAAVDSAINEYKAQMEKKEETDAESENFSSSDWTKVDEKSFLIEKHEAKYELKELFDEYEEYNISSKRYPTFDGCIVDLVRTEAPITEEYLLKKIAPLFGREKVTSVVKDNFFEGLEKYSNEIFKINDFYVTDKNMVIKMRIPKEGAVPRDVSMISNVEIASGLLEIIRASSGITEKGLFSTVASLLGFARMGNAMLGKFKESLQILIDGNHIKSEDEQYFVNK